MSVIKLFDICDEHEWSLCSSDMVSAVREILRRGMSINLYMFHGGTNFGFMSGALTNPIYKALITSYGILSRYLFQVLAAFQFTLVAMCFEVSSHNLVLYYLVLHIATSEWQCGPTCHKRSSLSRLMISVIQIMMHLCPNRENTRQSITFSGIYSVSTTVSWSLNVKIIIK